MLDSASEPNRSSFYGRFVGIIRAAYRGANWLFALFVGVLLLYFPLGRLLRAHLDSLVLRRFGHFFGKILRFTLNAIIAIIIIIIATRFYFAL